jgi:hypothetical protein
MIKLRCIFVASLALSLILTACSPALPAATRTSPVAGPTVQTATAFSTHEPADIGAPVFESLNGQSELLVISSLTGKPLDDFAPIMLTPNYDYAFAPDGSTLALVSAAQLYLVDLPSWKYRTSDVGLHGWPGTMTYSPDGIWILITSGGPDSNLRIVDAKSGQVKASAQAGFSITNARFTTDGQAIMVFGPHIAASGDAANAGVSIGAPKAALYAVRDLSLRWSVELSGVRAGTFPKKAGTENTQAIYQPGAAWHFDPGIAFAPARDIMYAVHGDEDKLTTVDFTSREVRTVRIHPKSSWLDQLMDLTAGVAYAKGMDGTSKQAVISPDGKYLYVVGTTEVVTLQAKGSNWDFKMTPLGLQVIEADDGMLVDKMDTQASLARMSPDGTHILLSGWKNDNYSTPWTDVYDASSGSIVKHLDSVSLLPTRRIDKTAILASNSYISENICYSASVDPGTWALASHWEGPCVEWLLNP